MANTINNANEIQVFNNANFGQVRSMMIDDEPWFVGKDVAEALGYAKPENAISIHIDDEDKTSTLIQGSGSNYKSKAILINESGLYSLIMSSKLPKAKEFKHWVTSEVLPTIRKTGSYGLIPSYQIEDPIARAKAWIVEKEKQMALETQLQIVEPKAKVYDELVAHDGYVGLREMSKMIGYPLHKLGKYLVEIKMCYKEGSTYYPYAEFSNNGMCVGRWHKAKWTSKGGMKTVWSMEGVAYVKESLKRAGLI